MKRLLQRSGSRPVLAAALTIALAGCTYLAFLDDDALEATLAFLDAPGTTRHSITERFGAPAMHGDSWVRFESGGLFPSAVNRKVLIVLFDENRRVSDYRYTGVKGCSMSRVLGNLPDDAALEEICRPGKTRAEVLSRLGPPLAAGPKMFAYLALAGQKLRGRIITFDKHGRFRRLTRTALTVPEKDTGCGADLDEKLVSKLREGMTRRQIKEILGQPQMAADDVWGYCATSIGRKKLVVVEFEGGGKLKKTRIREAFGPKAGRTSTCYVCHKLSFAPTCLDCHVFDSNNH